MKITYISKNLGKRKLAVIDQTLGGGRHRPARTGKRQMQTGRLTVQRIRRPLHHRHNERHGGAYGKRSFALAQTLAQGRPKGA